MNIFEIILTAITTILFISGFLAGLYYLFYKVFGVQFTTRSNHHRTVETNKIAHMQNLNALQEFDKETIRKAKENLSKNFFAHTSNNLIEEIRGGQNKYIAKNEYIPDLSKVYSYETLGIVFKDAIYCCFYNGITTYLQFINNHEGYIALIQDEPKPLSLKRWFNERNKNVVKFRYEYYATNAIKMNVFHNGKKFTYYITSKSPDYLNVSRSSPYNVNNLKFVICF